MTTFKLRNNDIRSYGFAGKLCVAGSGNTVAAEIVRRAKEQNVDPKLVQLPPLFELTEEEMFKSFRGVLAAMKTPTPSGRSAVEVFVDGVATPLSVDELEGWAADYRDRHKLPQPVNRADQIREMERAMARPEDPIEAQRRLERERENEALVNAVARTVLAALREAPAQPASPPATYGRNDEKPEQPVPAGRARQRPEEK